MVERLKTYLEGEVDYIANCDLDRMSLLELDAILKTKVKYGEAGRYYSKWPGNDDLMHMSTDGLAMKFFFQAFQKGRLVEIWVEHPISWEELVEDEEAAYDDDEAFVEEVDEEV